MMYIYKITNTINNKVYIGQTHDVAKRWYKHNYNAKSGRKGHLYDAMRKYGLENFTIEVIEECFDDFVDDRERYWIAFYNSTDKQFGYNKTFGGQNAYTWDFLDDRDTSSKRLSDSLKGHSVSMDTRKRLSQAFKNRIISDEQRQKISNTLKEGYKSGRIKVIVPPHPDRTGIPHTKEAKEKMSKWRTGKTYEEIYGPDKALQLKQNKRARWIGKNNPVYKDIDTNQIISLIKSGFKNKDIASMLNVSVQTIWQRLKQIGLTASEIRRGCYENNI